MFGPYRVTCEDEECSFEERIAQGKAAQTSAEAHSECHEHVVSITDVNTGATVEVSR